MKKESRSAHRSRMLLLASEFYSSDIPSSVLCDREGISASKFRYWCKQYKMSPNTTDFVPLEIVEQAISPSFGALKLTYPNGVQLEMDIHHLQPSLLKTLIGCLDS